MWKMALLITSTLYLFLTISGCGVSAQSSSPESCPNLGSDIRTLYSQLSRERLFMNFGAPAQCNGTVTSWHYCSYNSFQGNGDDDDDDDCEASASYTSVFLIYRQTGASTYEPVPGSMKSVTLTLNCANNGGFECRDVMLTQSEQFPVQENDIVAACLMANPIRLVGSQMSGSSLDVYQYDANNYEDCRVNQLRSIDVQNRAFTSGADNYRLHLYAETDSQVAQCTGGSNPPPFTAFTTSGTYLNTARPITCTDTITSWHYCYYPSEASDSQQTYTATVGVWRLNSTTNLYALLPGSNYTLSLVQPASTPAKIFCTRETLQLEGNVRVETGDVIGVSLPMSNPLPIVASGASDGYSLMTHNALNAPVVLEAAALTQAPNMALHLYPTIEFIPTEPPTTTQPLTTTEAPTTTQTPTTTARDNVIQETAGGGNGNNTGDFIAIAFGILILLIAVLVVTGIIAYRMGLLRRKRKVSGGRARYNVANDGVEFSLSQRGRGPSDYCSPSDPHYDRVEDTHDMIPHYEREGFITNEYSQVNYYSQVEACAAEYSTILEQVKEGKKVEAEEDPYYSPAKKENEIYAQLRRQGIKMIRQKDIELAGVLGEGQFSVVRKGMWKRNDAGFILEVAAKTLKLGSGERDKVKLLQEAAIMAQFKHPNVITVYGVVTTGRVTMIIVELLPKGDLKQHLMAMKPDPGMMLPSYTPRALLVFCQQVALGMQYLASKGFVHRDLAARNILLSEGNVCKIADFGMSRDLADDDYYVSQGGKVPIKWTAPEAIHFRKYSTASDVWSYGCLLYEIWSLGHKPFGAMQNPEVIAKVDSGYRLPPPPGCPQVIYKIMIDCWHPDKAERPGFRQVLLVLLEKEEVVMNIPSDAVTNSEAAILGGPLEAGFNLYPQLQTAYCDYTEP